MSTWQETYFQILANTLLDKLKTFNGKQELIKRRLVLADEITMVTSERKNKIYTERKKSLLLT